MVASVLRRHALQHRESVDAREEPLRARRYVPPKSQHAGQIVEHAGLLAKLPDCGRGGVDIRGVHAALGQLPLPALSPIRPAAALASEDDVRWGAPEPD